MDGSRKLLPSSDLYGRLWVCLLLIVALVSVVLYVRGFSLWTVLLVALALICPAVLLWGAYVVRRDDPAHRNARNAKD